MLCLSDVYKRQVARCLREHGQDFFTRQFGLLDLAGQEICQTYFLFRRGWGIHAGIERLTKLTFECAIDVGGIATRPRRHFGSQQTRNNSIFVGGPDRPIQTQENRTGTFLANKSERTIQQAGDKPFKTCLLYTSQPRVLQL